jgi:DNA-binding MarR family transcriptional regulator
VKRRSPSPDAPRALARVDEQLCFALYAAGNAMTRTYAPLLRPYDLTYVQYLTLLVLYESDDVPVGEIGRRLSLDSGTLTPVLKRLESRGYVKRRRSAVDEREVRVRLTPAGRTLETDLRRVQHDFFCSTALPVRRLEALRTELQELKRNLARAAAAHG